LTGKQRCVYEPEQDDVFPRSAFIKKKERKKKKKRKKKEVYISIYTKARSPKHAKDNSLIWKSHIHKFRK